MEPKVKESLAKKSYSKSESTQKIEKKKEEVSEKKQEIKNNKISHADLVNSMKKQNVKYVPNPTKRPIPKKTLLEWTVWNHSIFPVRSDAFPDKLIYFPVINLRESIARLL